MKCSILSQRSPWPSGIRSSTHFNQWNILFFQEINQIPWNLQNTCRVGLLSILHFVQNIQKIWSDIPVHILKNGFDMEWPKTSVIRVKKYQTSMEGTAHGINLGFYWKSRHYVKTLYETYKNIKTEVWNCLIIIKKEANSQEQNIISLVILKGRKWHQTSKCL